MGSARKEQALNLRHTLERLRRAREAFDMQEERQRQAVINKVLTPSVIVRSTNTSSATYRHYMNDPPMLQMRARQLEKAELVRKKVLVEAMQSGARPPARPEPPGTPHARPARAPSRPARVPQAPLRRARRTQPD